MLDNVFMSRVGISDPDRLLARRRVLIVDDDGDARDLMRFVLEACDMRVTDSESATDALIELEQSDFDLLISDIAMPVIDGYSFIGVVRSRKKNVAIPAVAMTAFTRADDRDRALLAGFDLHIGKPCDFATLISALTDLLATTGRPA
jgi:CheY-like chemotaxis protein